MDEYYIASDYYKLQINIQNAKLFSVKGGLFKNLVIIFWKMISKVENSINM